MVKQASNTIFQGDLLPKVFQELQHLRKSPTFAFEHKRLPKIYILTDLVFPGELGGNGEDVGNTAFPNAYPC